MWVWAHVITGTMSTLTSGVFMVKEWAGVLAQICCRVNDTLCSGHLVYLIILAITLFYQLSPKILRFVRSLNLGQYDTDAEPMWVLLDAPFKKSVHP
jgi:hypothetical protein